MNYEQKVLRDMEKWKLELSSKPNMFKRLSKNTQNKVNSFIPEKVHHFITESIKKMVQATLAGSNITTKKRDDIESLTLEEKEKLVLEKLDKFKRTAAAEGAGTGAGGILLGLADFPLLLSIKIKFLFEACSLYGFDPKKYEERLFLLYIFQLAFSSEEHRKEVLTIIENWENEVEDRKELDWRTLQQEYRDFLDLVKLFQMVPGFGAVVGAYANFNLLDQLGKTAMNCYRMRIMNKTRN
ncbi:MULTISPECIES: EcsC family protein [Sutcliffiella]|uniref:ABC transporter-associated protein EcsC n=1 Tax=Sutcliffiella cohnii TaxID=33932 RepID=A0A223KLY2_9BACI|nr:MULTISPECIES: EcsC family protein [Sutcliffiella]AST90495.1 ABC transporter-associated protein EcsC [Sutcliffiella cohnii]MED4017386.1 EcsC family protein [Sutcliffiella cohnii]WBL16147.1 EcsC family protein [Sutcliffiella sp. NC1]